jgi:ribosomal protein L40E
MEMMIIAVVALAAFTAVLLPLFRRGSRSAGADEFRGDRPAADPVRGKGVVPPVAAGPATPVDAAGTTRPAATPPADDAAAANPVPPQADVELEVQRYRAAMRAGTICEKCGQANPADSRFCFECGAQLPLAEAREFD